MESTEPQEKAADEAPKGEEEPQNQNVQQQGQGRRKKKKKTWKRLDVDLNYNRPSSETSNQPTRQQPTNNRGYGQNNSSSYASTTSNRDPYQQQAPSSSNSKVQSMSNSTRPRSEIDNISRFMAAALRHGRPKIEMDQHGYAIVSSVLSHPQFTRKFGEVREHEIQNLVDENSKKRFEISKDGEVMKIRATQGHSVKVDVQMEEITDPGLYKDVIHGTYKTAWRKIKDEGLNRFTRQHVHFAPGLLGETHVTSGMRYTCDIIIYLDMHKAMAGGLRFYKSVNNVILTEGNANGVVEPAYFKKVTRYNEKTENWDVIVDG